MNISFKIWFESQSLEIQVAQFLENILARAANMKKQDMATGIFKAFSHYTAAVLPHGSLPDNFPPDIAGKPVHFQILQNNKQADTLHSQGKFAGFEINTAGFDQARTPEEVDTALEALKSVVHHEVEHIYNVGKEYKQGQGQEKAMQYMSDPGELKAHARQIAHQYAKNFPGQPFDIKKAQSILNQPGFTQTHKNYFQTSNLHQIFNLIPQYLTQYTT